VTRTVSRLAGTRGSVVGVPPGSHRDRLRAVELPGRHCGCRIEWPASATAALWCASSFRAMRDKMSATRPPRRETVRDRIGLLRRLLFRAPLLLYRLGLGGLERLIGIEWIVLTTRGRRTGNSHSVMLDVIAHDAVSGTYYVQPADERRTHWVR